jgi:hypothetical protein
MNSIEFYIFVVIFILSVTESSYSEIYVIINLNIYINLFY